jgi:hypothetical protein
LGGYNIGNQTVFVNWDLGIFVGDLVEGCNFNGFGGLCVLEIDYGGMVLEIKGFWSVFTPSPWPSPPFSMGERETWVFSEGVWGCFGRGGVNGCR